jgi:hypothetical protein
LRWRRVGIGEVVASAGGFLVPAGFWPLWNRASTGHFLFKEYSDNVLAPVTLDVSRLLGEAVSSAFVPSSFYWGESAGPWVVLVLLGWLVLGGPREARSWALLSISGMSLYFLVVGFVVPYFLLAHSHGRYLGPMQLAFGLPMGMLLLEQCGVRLRAFLLAALLIPALVMAAIKIPRALVAAPAAFGLESRSAYLSKKIETFAAGERLKSEPGVKVLFVGWRPYYLEVPWTYLPDPKVQGREELIISLRGTGITHLIYEPNRLHPEWLRDPATWEGAPFRVLERWPSGVLLVKVEAP